MTPYSDMNDDEKVVLQKKFTKWLKKEGLYRESMSAGMMVWAIKVWQKSMCREININESVIVSLEDGMIIPEHVAEGATEDGRWKFQIWCLFDTFKTCLGLGGKHPFGNLELTIP